MVENYAVKIQNYRLNPKQTALIKEKMEFLLRQCPSNSLISFQCDYTNEVFSGHLTVNSYRKTFYAEADEPIFELFVKTLYKKVQTQVYRWKKSRTYEEITGVIQLKNYRPKESSDKTPVFTEELKTA